MESLVVTVIGADRPGLVESVSAAIEAEGGSWVESRMSRLAGQFAGILRASVPELRVKALTEALEALQARGLRVVVERGVEESVEEGHVIAEAKSDFDSKTGRPSGGHEHLQVDGGLLQ